jgi:hypothetical protein
MKLTLATAALAGVTATAFAADLRPGAAPSDRPRMLTVRPASGGVYYAGCNEVRRLGKAPLYAGQPGYRVDMDGDGDGIACEPHRNDGRGGTYRRRR